MLMQLQPWLRLKLGTLKRMNQEYTKAMDLDEYVKFIEELNP